MLWENWLIAQTVSPPLPSNATCPGCARAVECFLVISQETAQRQAGWEKQGGKSGGDDGLVESLDVRWGLVRRWCIIDVTCDSTLWVGVPAMREHGLREVVAGAHLLNVHLVGKCSTVLLSLN